MKLVEIFLPSLQSDGTPIDADEFEQVEATLIEKFGGVTAYHRAPANGRWRSPAEVVEVDDITIIEVVVASLDLQWWHHYRDQLLSRFQQQQLMIRVTEVQLI